MTPIIITLTIFTLIHGCELAVLYHALQVLKDHFSGQKAPNKCLNFDYRDERSFINLNVIVFIIFIFIINFFVIITIFGLALVATVTADKLLILMVPFIVLLLIWTDLHHLFLFFFILKLLLVNFGCILMMTSKFRLAHTILKSNRAMLLKVGRGILLLKLLKGNMVVEVLRVMPLMHDIVACIARFLLCDAIVVAKVRIGCEHGPRKILLVLVILMCHCWRLSPTHLLASVRPPT